MRVYSRTVQSHLAKTANSIITISEYSRQKIIEQFKIPAEKVSVIYLAASDLFSSQHDRGTSNLALPIPVEKYSLSIASASARKNISRLLSSYALIPSSIRSEYPLMLICSHPAYKTALLKKAAALEISNDVVILNRVSDEHLAALYRAASLFIFPSLEEGFGLPPLEAMASGTPVVASNTSSIPEVVGNAALLVSPIDINEMADGITSVLTNPVLAQELIQAGRERARMFSWTKVAKETLNVYTAIAGE